MKERLPEQVLAELFANSLVYTGEKFNTDNIYSMPAKPIHVNTDIQQKTRAQHHEPVDTSHQLIIEKPSITQPSLTKEKVNTAGKWYLGNYEKQFIVLVNDADNVYLSDRELELLTGILNACKLNMAHIALINFKNYPLNFQQLKKDMQPKFIVAFGVNALQIELPFSMPDYQVQPYDGCTILTAPQLAVLNAATPSAKAEKSKLWNSLKKMLNI